MLGCLSFALMHTSIGRIKLPVGLQRWRHGTSECMPIGRLHKADFKLCSVKVASPFKPALPAVIKLKSGLSGRPQTRTNIPGAPSLLSERFSVTEFVSSMGHPPKLLSSQVVAIQWFLLQGRRLAFVKRNKQLHHAVERVGTLCGARWTNFGPRSVCLGPDRNCLYHASLLFLGCVAQLIQLLFDKYPAYPLHMHVSDL